MKKNILLSFTLSAMALAAIFAGTFNYSTRDEMLRENIEAIAGQDIKECYKTVSSSGEGRCVRVVFCDALGHCSEEMYVIEYSNKGECS